MVRVPFQSTDWDKEIVQREGTQMAIFPVEDRFPSFTTRVWYRFELVGTRDVNRPTPIKLSLFLLVDPSDYVSGLDRFSLFFIIFIHVFFAQYSFYMKC